DTVGNNRRTSPYHLFERKYLPFKCRFFKRINLCKLCRMVKMMWRFTRSDFNVKLKAMEKYYNECVQKLEEKIQELTIEVDNPILLPQEVVGLVIGCLSKLKEFVLKRGFKSTEEEIHFFKRLKPVILAKLIYYNAIYKIETKKPYGNGKAIKKYIDNELTKLKRYFDNNLEFYKYYRTNSTYLDEKYFVRGVSFP